MKTIIVAVLFLLVFGRDAAFYLANNSKLAGGIALQNTQLLALKSKESEIAKKFDEPEFKEKKRRYDSAINSAKVLSEEKVSLESEIQKNEADISTLDAEIKDLSKELSVIRAITLPD